MNMLLLTWNEDRFVSREICGAFTATKAPDGRQRLSFRATNFDEGDPTFHMSIDVDRWELRTHDGHGYIAAGSRDDPTPTLTQQAGKAAPAADPMEALRAMAERVGVPGAAEKNRLRERAWEVVGMLNRVGSNVADVDLIQQVIEEERRVGAEEKAKQIANELAAKARAEPYDSAKYTGLRRGPHDFGPGL